MQFSEPGNRIRKIVSNLSDLFEDPDSVRDTGHALVLLLNTYTRFQGGNHNMLCSIRNLQNYILSFVSKLALVLLLNTYTRFQTIIEVYSSAVGV